MAGCQRAADPRQQPALVLLRQLMLWPQAPGGCPPAITPALSLRGHACGVTISALPRSVPDPQHPPAAFAQRAVHRAIPRLVGCKLAARMLHSTSI